MVIINEVTLHLFNDILNWWNKHCIDTNGIMQLQYVVSVFQ